MKKFIAIMAAACVLAACGSHAPKAAEELGAADSTEVVAAADSMAVEAAPADSAEVAPAAE